MCLRNPDSEKLRELGISWGTIPPFSSQHLQLAWDCFLHGFKNDIWCNWVIRSRIDSNQNRVLNLLPCGQGFLPPRLLSPIFCCLFRGVHHAHSSSYKSRDYAKPQWSIDTRSIVLKHSIRPGRERPGHESEEPQEPNNLMPQRSSPLPLSTIHTFGPYILHTIF